MLGLRDGDRGAKRDTREVPADALLDHRADWLILVGDDGDGVLDRDVQEGQAVALGALPTSPWGYLAVTARFHGLPGRSGGVSRTSNRSSSDSASPGTERGSAPV